MLPWLAKTFELKSRLDWIKFIGAILAILALVVTFALFGPGLAKNANAHEIQVTIIEFEDDNGVVVEDLIIVQVVAPQTIPPRRPVFSPNSNRP